MGNSVRAETESGKPASDPIDDALAHAVAARRSEIAPLVAMAARVTGAHTALSKAVEIARRLSGEGLLERVRKGVAEGERRRHARVAFRALVDALVMPDERTDRWLRGVIASLDTTPTGDELRDRILAAVEESSPENTREALLAAGGHGDVPDDKLARVLAKVRPDASGATNRRAASVAAELSLLFQTFDDKRQRHEPEPKAIQRIAKAFRSARKRHEKRSTRADV